MSRFLLPLTAALLLAAPLTYAQSLPQGTARYTIAQNGKQVGSAQVSTSPLAGGYTLSSSGSLHLDKFSYSFQNNETVDSEGNLVRDSLGGSVHGAKTSGSNIQFDTTSNSTGRSFDLRILANGKQTTNTVDRHRNCVLLPDLDPAAYVLMTHLALSPPRTSWVLIPKQNGILVPAEYQTLDDLHGTLNGQNLTVKHAAVAISAQNSLVIELFYTATGDLLEADLNAQGFRVAQPGFVLQNRPTPIAPPAGEAPTQNGQQGANPGGNQGPGPGGNEGPAAGGNQGQQMQPY